MRLLSLAIGLAETALPLLLLWRAGKGKFIARFPLFYSYVVYGLGWSTAVFVSSQFFSPLPWTIYWRFFLVNLIAEFGVLVEISDHIFNPYPAIRNLGRVLTVLICVVFSVFILPTLVRSGSQTMGLLAFGEITSATKAAIVCFLLVTARQYGIPLGKNVSGLMLGFSVFVGVNVANFALAERLGRALYGSTFGLVGALSYTLCLFMWTVALWSYEPVVPESSSGRAGGQESSESLAYRLEQFNTTLGSLLRK
jgi:hypothetical protein